MKRNAVSAATAAHDILREKKREAESLEQQADDAVELVTRTVNRLDLINQQLDDHMAEIDAYTKELEQTRVELAEQRKRNAAISANFTKLLSMEDTADEESAPQS